MGIILGYYRDAYWSTSISECHKECVSWELGTSRSFTSWFCNCTLMNSDHVDGYMFVFFFKIWGILLRFHMLCQQGGEGRHLEKPTCWEAKTAPSILLGDYGHRLSIFGFASITVAFNNMKPWLSEESGYDVVILDSTHIFNWSIRECYSLILPKNTSSKKTWRRSSPVLPKKSELYFWVGLVWLLLVVSLVTPKTHITLKKWWLADWQTAFPLKLPFIFCFFFFFAWFVWFVS